MTRVALIRDHLNWNMAIEVYLYLYLVVGGLVLLTALFIVFPGDPHFIAMFLTLLIATALVFFVSKQPKIVAFISWLYLVPIILFWWIYIHQTLIEFARFCLPSIVFVVCIHFKGQNHSN